MNIPFRRGLAALTIAISPAAFAGSSFSFDVSDLWWNPAESGWGLNLEQQGDTVFATLFVYAPDGQPHWYVSPDMGGILVSTSAGVSFFGDLYEATGPGMAGTFNPAAVARRKVGGIAFETHGVGAASLSYTVDGVSVAKSVQRQTWRANDFTGSYRGWHAGRYQSCGARDSTLVNDQAQIDIVQSGTSFAMSVAAGSTTCSYNGTYTQQGRLGEVNGSYSCGNSQSGTFRLWGMEVNTEGFLGRLDRLVPDCALTGRIGGVRPQ